MSIENEKQRLEQLKNQLAMLERTANIAYEVGDLKGGGHYAQRALDCRWEICALESELQLIKKTEANS